MGDKKAFVQVVDLGGNVKPYGGYVDKDGYLRVKYKKRDIIKEPNVYDSNFKRIVERSRNHQSLTMFICRHRYIFALAYSLLIVGIGLGLR